MVPNQVTFPYERIFLLPIIPRAPINSVVGTRLRDDGAESAKRLNMALVLLNFLFFF